LLNIFTFQLLVNGDVSLNFFTRLRSKDFRNSVQKDFFFNCKQMLFLNPKRYERCRVSYRPGDMKTIRLHFSFPLSLGMLCSCDSQQVDRGLFLSCSWHILLCRQNQGWCSKVAQSSFFSVKFYLYIII
jgi:hypothetical protein